jgi:hypothetical protein
MARKAAALMALAAAAAGSLVAPHSKAVITDSLTGPTTSDMSVFQSALTASPATDNRWDNTTPNISSNYGTSFGNSRFGAGINTGSWTGLNTSGYAEGYQSLSATATVFGDTRTALQAYIYALTATTNANVYSYIYALGNLVRSGSHTGGDFNGTTFLTNLSQDLWNSGSQTFYISIIPITVGATVKATAGQSLYGHVWYDGVNAHLFQNGGLTASAFGGIGPSWANAGISVNNLTLANASLSLTSTALFQQGGSPCAVNAAVGSNMNVYLKELSGEISLYAKANLLFTTISDSYKIASWPGLTQSWTLFNLPATTKSMAMGCFSVPAAPVIQGLIIG